MVPAVSETYQYWYSPRPRPRRVLQPGRRSRELYMCNNGHDSMGGDLSPDLTQVRRSEPHVKVYQKGGLPLNDLVEECTC